MYTACRTNYPLDKLLFQEDLVNLKVIPDNNVEILVQCAQALTNQNLFRIYTLSGRLARKVVKEDDAAKYVLSKTYGACFVHIFHVEGED